MPDVNYFEMNRRAWDCRTLAHIESVFYDVKGFLAGNTSLQEIELDELVNVSGRRLLHLQCHFGLDTLSWVRMGAECTGVDISPVAIEQADNLKRQAGLEARFVCSNLYSYLREDEEPFDIVYVSYGSLCWLPDIGRWADIVSANLVPGGTFYMVEFHPIYDLLTGYSYFAADCPDIEKEGTYTENGADAVAELATWAHSLSDVVGALINSRIQIEQLREFPFSPYNCFEGMKERQPGRFYINHKGYDIPLVYSIKGRKVC